MSGIIMCVLLGGIVATVAATVTSRGRQGRMWRNAVFALGGAALGAMAGLAIGFSSLSSAGVLPEIGSEEQFQTEVLRSSHVVLVDFSAPWCVVCKVQTPILVDLRGRNLPGVQIVSVNTDRLGRLAGHFEIEGLPTMILFRDGRPVERFEGYTSRATLEKALSRYTL